MHEESRSFTKSLFAGAGCVFGAAIAIIIVIIVVVLYLRSMVPDDMIEQIDFFNMNLQITGALRDITHASMMNVLTNESWESIHSDILQGVNALQEIRAELASSTLSDEYEAARQAYLGALGTCLEVAEGIARAAANESRDEIIRANEGITLCVDDLQAANDLVPQLSE